MADADGSLDELIERLARQARLELQRMAEKARDEISIRLGFVSAALKRGRSERRRIACRRAIT